MFGRICSYDDKDRDEKVDNNANNNIEFANSINFQGL